MYNNDKCEESQNGLVAVEFRPSTPADTHSHPSIKSIIYVSVGGKISDSDWKKQKKKYSSLVWDLRFD